MWAARPVASRSSYIDPAVQLHAAVGSVDSCYSKETADPSTALLAMKPARSFAQDDTSVGTWMRVPSARKFYSCIGAVTMPSDERVRASLEMPTHAAMELRHEWGTRRPRTWRIGSGLLEITCFPLSLE
jgi:hypothetical protein